MSASAGLPSHGLPGRSAPAGGWTGEIVATLRLAWPLILAQLGQMALLATDAIMMGWLGAAYFAAGTLAVTAMHPFALFGMGLASAVAPLVAQARGAGDEVSLRRSVRQGLWAVIGAATLMAPLIWHFEAVFLFFGQSPEIARLAESYARPALWMFYPLLGFVVLRGLITAHDDTGVILPIMAFGIVANAMFNYALMFGHWGFPRLELAGAGISTSLVNALMFLLLLAHIQAKPIYRGYSLLVRFWKPDWPRLWRILRLGVPIGLMMLAEVGLFAAAGFFMGWLGTDELAAHGVALQLAAISFMVPMGLSHAATVRVALARGRGSAEDVRRAGWVAIGLGTGVMTVAATAFWLVPETLVSLYLDPSRPENRAAIALAVSYLAIAALFQLFDGAQVVSAAVLRGLNDTAVPMMTALAGYWGVGLTTAYLLGFVYDLRGVGVWIGLAAGLASVALVLTARFTLRRRFGIV